MFLEEVKKYYINKIQEYLKLTEEEAYNYVYDNNSKYEDDDVKENYYPAFQAKKLLKFIENILYN